MEHLFQYVERLVQVNRIPDRFSGTAGYAETLTNQPSARIRSL